ncbi:2-dehydro-3-deoxygalactonokinase [Danxiaibacter flavus]|uniref:2-dehydro-3-deoxygalactonokinase n=1 Tax=Danxiaibacter flavus TaxID=3049108 RepID=A0ABV3ZCQ4_9BACT|nr:2-dehydro-3-deoxygalactonokinase [Chitinophagaceae bacterium DXS]
MQPTQSILSCDWGTSNFRLRLVDTDSNSTIAEFESQSGITQTYQQWKEAGEKPDTRLEFYLAQIRNGIEALEKQQNIQLKNVPVVISGMASSSIGMIELPYKDVPFLVDGSDLSIHTIPASTSFPHETLVISGARTGNDVMRGEETQLAGCHQAAETHEQLFIFPGTHSKHIAIHNGRVVTFKTYMTGEIFNLLSQKSILSVSVTEGRNLSAGNNLHFFNKGVTESLQGNLLNHLFHIRTNQLFQQCTNEENYYYLTGLLIGSELKDLQQQPFPFIQIVSNTALAQYYQAALNLLFAQQDVSIQIVDGGNAVTEGHVHIWKRTQKLYC